MATITESLGDHVWGCLWELNDEHLKTLDEQESHYNRFQVSVMMSNKQMITANTYQLKDEHLNEGEIENLPSPMYKKVILSGAIEHDLPGDYIQFLKSIPDNGYQGSIRIPLPDSFLKQCIY